jgi:type II secretory pathway pseudopilin PulG
MALSIISTLPDSVPQAVRPCPDSVNTRERRGLTLIEIMVSLAAAMVVLAAVISVLGMVTKGVSDSRTMIEATNRLRSASVLLRHDLAGATNPGLVKQKGEMGNGYLEIVEGSGVDDDSSDRLGGDIDDRIAFTTRSTGAPFVGKTAGGDTVTSSLAEVVWFVNPSPAQTFGDGTVVYNLHRRAFLICPNVPGVTGAFSGNTTHPQQDLSYHNNGTSTVPCSLGDLSIRKNRAFHSNSNTTTLAPVVLASPRDGEDIVLTNVLAFDVKVFDPTAQNHASGNLGLVPGDRGYAGSTNNTGIGAYVDLGRGAGSRFGVAMNTKANLSGSPTYDTWSFDYEYGGRYVNGIDDNGDGVVDDADERETMPPYPYPMRGVQIKIRVYEPSSKQVREVTIEETFVP